MSHSVATAASIAEWTSERWEIATIVHSELVRSYVNDTYLLVSDQGDYALKMFRRSWRNRGDAMWEAQLCVHLDAHGVPLATPILGRDGQHVQILSYPEGDRAALLTPWLGGFKPNPPWTEDLYRNFGRAAARMHQASISFVPAARGRLLNADHLIRRPIAKLRDHFADRPETIHQLLDGAQQMARELDSVVPQLPFGVCQGDLTLDNLHILPDGAIALYDFDLGGHGWFAFDFAFFDGWMRRDENAVTWWNAFQTGYGEIREVTDAEIQAMPLFDVAYLIWDLEHTIHNWTDWSGTWNATESIVTRKIEEITRRY
jgi:Ser/Thr protein kinase RdoA (MazF antagonist)